MDQESFRPTRKPLEIPEVHDNMPPQLQHALRKNAERAAQVANEKPEGPRLAFTGNAKLDEIMAGIKETVNRYEEVQLPSRGKFYDDIPNGTIHIRCMTSEEEEILGTIRYVKTGKAVNMIFRNCIRENIQPEKLLSVDRTWLLIFLRGISYTHNYDVEVKCSECGYKFSDTIDLDSLFVTRCPEEFGPDSLKDTLPKTGLNFIYRLPTGKDEHMVNEYRDKKNKNADQVDDTWAYRASLLIKDIEGITDQPSIHTLMRNLPINDSSYLRSLFNEPPFGVNTKIEMLCKSCSETFEIELPFETGFFFPNPRKGKSIRA